VGTLELIPKVWSVTLSGRLHYETFTPWKWPGVTTLTLNKEYLSIVVHESRPLPTSVAKALAKVLYFRNVLYESGYKSSISLLYKLNYSYTYNLMRIGI